MLTSTTIQYQEHDAVLEVILNREGCCNAINSVMMAELLELWDFLASQTTWRCVILTGKGSRAFCAGADLKERQGLDVATWQEQHAVLQQAMIAMHRCPIPLIAAVNGVAFGGGLELTLACDFALASETAVFSQSEVKLGIMPGAMGTQLLPRAVGLRRAKQLALTGQSFSAHQAMKWGVVNQVCQPEELMTTTMGIANTIVANAPLAVQACKQSLNHAVCDQLLNGYAYEVTCYNQLLKTNDRIEGINAFNEKRKPIFIGE